MVQNQKLRADLVKLSSVQIKFCPRGTSLLDSMATTEEERFLSTESCWQKSRKLSTHTVFLSVSSVICLRRLLSANGITGEVLLQNLERPS